MFVTDDYVGLPFKPGGRDRNGLDCWGLVRLVYREQLGFELPSYSSEYVTVEDAEAIADLIAGRNQRWREIREPEVESFDVVLMKRLGFESHIGVIPMRGYVLHVGLHGRESSVDRYTSLRLKKRVARFFRYGAD